MIFNLVISKQSKYVFFSRKAIATTHATVYFNNDPVIRGNSQNISVCFVYSKLNFSDHVNEKVIKVTKGIKIIRKMNLSLPQSSLLTTHKSFVRSHLGYDDVIYGEFNNSRLSGKIEKCSVQHCASNNRRY